MKKCFHYYQVELRALSTEPWCSDSQRFESTKEAELFVAYLIYKMEFSPANVRVIRRRGDINSQKIGEYDPIPVKY